MPQPPDDAELTRLETITTEPVPRPDEPPWLAIARAEMGVSEIPGAASNPRIEQYHAVTAGGPALDEVAWCSSFACWCLERAGIRSPRRKNARSWLTWGFPLAEPRLGCVVVLARGDNAAQGHVGFYVGDRRVAMVGPRRLLLCGGNQSDRVSISAYPYPRVLGYRWVASG